MIVSPQHPQPFGNYLLLERVGRGGFADIFRATRAGGEGVREQVAIKRIFPHLAEDFAFVSMFIEEAELSARLSHPNVVRVEKLGTVDGVLYIAMEFIRGRDLSQVLSRLQSKGQCMSPVLAAYIVSCIAQGLHHAHSRTGDDDRPLCIIHRDVSPHNVLLSWQGEVKLADFGIAKAATSLTATETGRLKGKLAYLAPEQLEDQADHRSDIYSAGVILWELLTGRRLFTGETDWQILQRVAAGDIPRASDLVPVSKDLQTILDYALALERGERFQTARQLYRALQGFIARKGHTVGNRELAGRLEALYAEDNQAARASDARPLRGQVHRIASKPRRASRFDGRFRGVELVSERRGLKVVLVFSERLSTDLYDFPIYCWEGAHVSVTNLQFSRFLEDESLVFEVTADSQLAIDGEQSPEDELPSPAGNTTKEALEEMVIAAGGKVER